jgi:hypothetical protein
MTGPRAHGAPAVCSPAVTVIVPTRDRARYLHDAIGSVLGQTFADQELLRRRDHAPRRTDAKDAPRDQNTARQRCARNRVTRARPASMLARSTG